MISLQETLLRAWLRDASTPLPGDLVQLGGEELGIALQQAEAGGVHLMILEICGGFLFLMKRTKNPIFLGKYHQNGVFSMAMLVYSRRVYPRGSDMMNFSWDS